MSDLIALSLPKVTLVAHVILVLLLVAGVSKATWGEKVLSWIGKNATLLAFLTALSGIVGSLFYSEVMGFEPCILCWWQRVLIYPLVLIFATALWKRLDSAFAYAIPLVSIALIIGIYQAYASIFGASFLPCTAQGGSCSKVYILDFGYITIPVMSLTISLYILVIAWIRKLYENRNA